MKTLTLKLSLVIEFDPQGTHPDDLRKNLYQVVRDATNNGTLTSSTPATVESYDYLVEQMPRFAALKRAKFDRIPWFPKKTKLKRYPKETVIAYARKHNTKAAARRLMIVDSGSYKVTKS